MPVVDLCVGILIECLCLPLEGLRIEHDLEEGGHLCSEPGRVGVVSPGNPFEQQGQIGLIKGEVACHDDIQQHTCKMM